MILLGWKTTGDNAKPKICRPAFRSMGELAGFVCLLAMFVFGPSLLNKFLPTNPADVYKGVPLFYGNYHFVGETISKNEVLDVLVLGASDGATSIDSAVLAEVLEEKLGRPAKVANLSSNWAGEDRHHQILQDFYSQGGKVKLVLGFENDALQKYPHELAKFWWRGGGSTAELSPSTRAQFAMMSSIGLPRQIWNRWIGGSRSKPTPSYQPFVDKMRLSSGFLGEEHGFLSYIKPEKSRRQIVAAPTSIPQIPVEAFFFQGNEDDNFKWQYYGYSPLFTTFSAQTAALVQKNGGVYATIAVPTHFKEKMLERVIIRALSDGKKRSWPTLGISQARLFPGLEFDKMKNYYSNESHLNRVGASYFTRTIAPAIIKLISDAT